MNYEPDLSAPTEVLKQQLDYMRVRQQELRDEIAKHESDLRKLVAMEAEYLAAIAALDKA